MHPIKIKIPKEPLFDKQVFDAVRARMIYLESFECRLNMTQVEINEERKQAIEKFKELIQCVNYPNDTTISH
jgi:hypothetical protein